MKILHVSETLKGGPASYLDELLPGMQDRLGAGNVILLVPRNHADYLECRPASTVRTFKRPGRKSGILYLMASYIKTMRDVKPDLIHAHSTFAGMVARVLRPLFPYTPVIYCPHGWAMDMEQSPLRKALIGKAERFLARACEKIVAISEYEREGGIRAGIPAGKLVMIHNGIAQSGPAFEPVEWNDQRLKILFVGRFDRQKGLDILLEAAASLEDRISLKLVGDLVTDDGTVCDFERYAFAERLGWLRRPEVAAWIEQCDAVVVPSRWEGFGLVALEAMRAGKAVIASKVGGLGEILVDGESGHYVAPNDVEALRDVLRGLDRAALQKAGAAAKQRFASHFTGARMVERIVSLYEGVLRDKAQQMGARL